jgi:hypothetical protein
MSLLFISLNAPHIIMSIFNGYPTKRTTGDLAHWITKIGLSAIPHFGGPAVEVFQYLKESPLERRRDSFIQQLGERFVELEAKGIKLENLQQNEQFISAVLQVTQTALRTHQADKLAALRNVLVNLAQGQTVEETLLHILLSHIDTLSEMHLRTLKVLQAPTIPPEWNEDGDMHSFSELIIHNIPELRESSISSQLLVDLNARGLIGIEFNTGVRARDVTNRVTSIGESLIRLITDQGG